MLRIEGTTAGGFLCDAVGCGLNAVWSPIFCTPYLGEPQRAPILNFTAITVCHHHWKNIGRELSTDHMKEATRAIAERNGGVPDFDKIFLSRIGVFSGDYNKFLEMAGLIAPGDMMVKSDAAMPEF